MKKARPIPWRKGIEIALVAIGSCFLMWWTEARFFGSRYSIVQMYGLLAIIAGVVCVLGIAGYLWWKDRREEEELENKYGARDESDI